MRNLVSEPEDVDAAWLTEALRSGGAIGHEQVVGFTAEPIGTGQVGHNVRYDLVYDVPGHASPASLVIKFPSPDETSRATGIAVRTYDKEARFYRELAATVDIKIPKCFRVEHDPDAHLSTLVFQDMAPAQQGDQLVGCSVAQAELVVDEMSSLHAPRWDDPSLDQIDWLTRPGPDTAQTIQGFYRLLWPGFVERFGERVSPEVIELGARLGNGLAEWSNRRESGPITIIHGDFRLDNLLFAPSEGRHPGPVTTVDWQTVALGVGPDDLAYFLGSGLVSEDRRKHEDTLVRRYYENLMKRGVRSYSWETCWADYRRFTLSGLQMAVIASTIVRADERGDAMFIAMAERHTAHALELGAEQFLPE